MERHNTHLLSDESEEEKKKSDPHEYNFNNSNSSSISEEKLISKELEKNNPLNVNILNKNNNEKDIIKDNNISIISSKELEDIFCNEDDMKKNELKKKKKKKKNKYFIKLRKIKLNKEKNDEIIDYCLTYNYLLENSYIDKKIKNENNRKCISLNNLDKNNNNKNDKTNLQKNNLKEKEVFYLFYNDDHEGNKKLKRVINMINQTKSQLLKISNSNFAIKAKRKRKRRNNLPLISKDNKNYNYNYNINENLDKEVRQRKINYSKIVRDLNINKIKKDNKLIVSKNKKLILKSNNNTSNITMKNHFGKTPNQSHSVIFKSNKSNDRVDILYSIYLGKQNKGNNKKIQKLQRVKSTESLIENKKKESAWIRMNNYHQENTKYQHIHNNEKENRSLVSRLYKIKTGENSNNNNYHNNIYNLHFGNNDNCPLCQAKEHQNEENIKKMGIFPMVPNVGGNENNFQNSWHNRRVYSALSRVLLKRKKSTSEYEFNNDNNYNFNYGNKRSRSKSLSKNKSISKENKSKISSLGRSNFNDNQKNLTRSTNNTLVKKISMNNRPSYMQSNFSTSYKFLSSKNLSEKYN